MTDLSFETVLKAVWWSGCTASCVGMVGLIFRNQIVRAWQRTRHIPAYVANHRIIKEITVPEQPEPDYSGRHRYMTGLTGLFPTIKRVTLPLDPTTVVVDGELVAERDDAALVGA